MNFTNSAFIILGAISFIACPVPVSAGIFTYEDGVCVSDPFEDCREWRGPDGFYVTSGLTSDMTQVWGPVWPEAADNGWGFNEDFGLDSFHDFRSLVIRRDQPFDLTALQLSLGSDCPTPLEVRSSNLGRRVVEPNTAAAGAICSEAFTETGPASVPWPWSPFDGSILFSGPEWRQVDWIYVGFLTYGPEQYPYPWFTSAYVRSVAYAPEASSTMLIVFGVGVATNRFRRTRLRHAQP